eukprot:1143059-Pelagomonas_calceolata.AAC.6
MPPTWKHRHCVVTFPAFLPCKKKQAEGYRGDAGGPQLGMLRGKEEMLVGLSLDAGKGRALGKKASQDVYRSEDTRSFFDWEKGMK